MIPTYPWASDKQPGSTNEATMSRRSAIAIGSVTALQVSFTPSALAKGDTTKLPPIGFIDSSTGMADDPAAFALARRAGLDGVEISTMRPADTLSFATKQQREIYSRAIETHGVVVCSTCPLLMLHHPLQSDPRGEAWLRQSVETAAFFDADAVLVPFFAKGDLIVNEELHEPSVAATVKKLQAVAPMAADRGVTLGIENTLSAAQNLQILERVGHDSVRIYYDIANSSKRGYDVPAEIRRLKDLVCRFHLKDNAGRFPTGQPEIDPIIEAIQSIGYDDWIVLERNFEPETPAAYFRHNARYVRDRWKSR